MNCTKCGKEVEASNTFCANCGEKIVKGENVNNLYSNNIQTNQNNSGVILKTVIKLFVAMLLGLFVGIANGTGTGVFYAILFVLIYGIALIVDAIYKSKG